MFWGGRWGITNINSGSLQWGWSAPIEGALYLTTCKKDPCVCRCRKKHQRPTECPPLHRLAGGSNNKGGGVGIGEIWNGELCTTKVYQFLLWYFMDRSHLFRCRF